MVSLGRVQLDILLFSNF